MYEIGSVVLLKRVIFKSCVEGGKIIYKNKLDHAYKRPALVIAEDSESTYFLHITSKIGYDLCSKTRIYIGEKTKDFIGGFAIIDSIQKRNICYREEIQMLDSKIFVDVLKCFCDYQENIKMDEEYPKIKDQIYQKIESLNNEIDKQKVYNLTKK